MERLALSDARLATSVEPGCTEELLLGFIPFSKHTAGQPDKLYKPPPLQSQSGLGWIPNHLISNGPTQSRLSDVDWRLSVNAACVCPSNYSSWKWFKSRGVIWSTTSLACEIRYPHQGFMQEFWLGGGDL
jgi:hypothetical protein